MSRWASQSSFRSGQGSVHGNDPHDQALSSQLQQSLSQMSFPLFTGNHGFQGNHNGSTLYHPSSPTFPDFTTHHEEGNEIFSVTEPFSNETFEPPHGSHPRTHMSEDGRFGMFSAVPDEASFTPTLEGPRFIPSTVSEASISSSILSDQPPYGWEGTVSYPDSARNSPHFATNEPWSGVPLGASSTTSPREETSDLKSLSPRFVFNQSPVSLNHTHKFVLDRNSRKPANSKAGESDLFDDSFQLSRQTAEMDNVARNDPLYHNAQPGPDGLYHCPWEGDSICQHKGEKLKCNYE